MSTGRVCFQGSGWGIATHLVLENPDEVLRVEADQPAELEGLLSRLDELSASGDAGRIAVGFLTYEACVHLEGSRSLFRKPQRTPLAWFGLFRIPPHAQAGLPRTRSSTFGDPISSLDGEEWARGVDAIRRAIERGDVYQVNLTRRMTVAGSVDPFTLARALFQENPVPFALAIEAEEFSTVSNSPELLLDHDAAQGTLESRPIKGTIARGTGSESDERAREELLKSEKDAAEHLMIVDLIRNDLGRCCRPGSVRVSRLRDLLTFRHLHHLESTIVGRIAEGTRLSDVFRSLLPGGSITGAPKRAALGLIRALEPCPRGIYTGAVGYIRGNGRSVFNVPIRTAILGSGRADYHAGGGIVWDSEAGLEWAETETKSLEFRAVLNAMNRDESERP